MSVGHTIFPGAPKAIPENIAPHITDLFCRTVHASQWPTKPTEAMAKKVFPTATRVMLPKEGDPFAGDALLVFESVDAAKQAAKKWTTVKGKALALMWIGGLLARIRAFLF